MSKKNDTFERIRLARLEKIQIDVKMRKIKLAEMEHERDYRDGCFLSVEDVLKAVNRVFEHPSGTCSICEHKMRKLLRLIEDNEPETDNNEQEENDDDQTTNEPETQN